MMQLDYLASYFLLRIEPYWNVNKNAFVTGDYSIDLRIEPYWNVNILDIQTVSLNPGLE